MTELRHTVGEIIREAGHYEDDVDLSSFADRILAIPEIAAALALQRQADSFVKGAIK